MERIAIYGKGGVGKSVVATALSACFGQAGKRVLHVGCDPKADSAVRLLDGNVAVRTVLDVLGDDPNAVSDEAILNRGRLGIDCCEAGGPHAGLGCGGRGVARMIEYLDENLVLQSGRHDVVIFDVLGDVVCGGFAAPLREGFAEKVVIVVSGQPMALFAANNISRAVLTYSRNGVVLAGLVVNQHEGDDVPRVERFAGRLGTRVLAVIPRDPAIMAAEVRQRTIVEDAPDSATTRAFQDLAQAVVAVDASQVGVPTPMSDTDFFTFLRENGG